MFTDKSLSAAALRANREYFENMNKSLLEKVAKNYEHQTKIIVEQINRVGEEEHDVY